MIFNLMKIFLKSKYFINVNKRIIKNKRILLFTSLENSKPNKFSINIIQIMLN